MDNRRSALQCSPVRTSLRTNVFTYGAHRNTFNAEKFNRRGVLSAADRSLASRKDFSSATSWRLGHAYPRLTDTQQPMLIAQSRSCAPFWTNISTRGD